MFPFVVDHRHTFEPSLAIYHASRSAFKSSTRGTRPRPNETASYSSGTEAPPPAYTETAASNRKNTLASIDSTSSASSTTSDESTTSKRSKLARFNPFSRFRGSSSSSSSSTPATSSATSSTRTKTRKASRVQFADYLDTDDSEYDSDVSDNGVAATETKSSRKSRRSTRRGSSSAGEEYMWLDGRQPGQGLGYPRAVDDNMMRCFWMGI